MYLGFGAIVDHALVAIYFFGFSELLDLPIAKEEASSNRLAITVDGA
jgi:hypothetical protein